MTVLDIQMFVKTIITCVLIVFIKTFTPEILLIDLRIKQLEERNRQLRAIRNNVTLKSTTSALSLSKYAPSQVKFNSRCFMSGQNLSGFLFQTTTNVYFAVNIPSNNSVGIYSQHCQNIANLEDMHISQVLCDRGVCQGGTLHFLTNNRKLYSASQDNNFTSAHLLAQLEEGVVGGVVRSRGKDKLEIYLGWKDGKVQVLDESGVGKLRIQLQGFDSNLLAITDHHPYPILLMRSHWISLLDTTKYAEVSANCPHLPEVLGVLAESYYGDALYVVTASKIYLLDFQLSKKNCHIKRQYSLDTPLESARSLSFFSNTIFADNRAFNLTDKRMQVLEQNCQSASLDFMFKKGQGQQVYALKQVCSLHECTLELLEVRRLHQDRSILFWLTLAFIAVLFLSLAFMKKSNVNNLDLDDPVAQRQREVQQQIMALAPGKKNSKAKRQ